MFNKNFQTKSNTINYGFNSDNNLYRNNTGISNKNFKNKTSSLNEPPNYNPVLKKCRKKFWYN